MALVVACLLVVSSAWAEGEQHFGTGTAEIENKHFEQISHNGPLHLEEVTVTQLVTVNGSLTAEESQFQDLTVNGQVELDEVQIKGRASIHGALKAKESRIQHLNVSGAVELEEVEIAGPAAITGRLKAEKTKFLGPLSVVSNQIELSESEAMTIRVEVVQPPQEQIVKLEDQSRVIGNIEFVAGNGKVMVEKGSTLEGRVIGGQLIQKD